MKRSSSPTDSHSQWSIWGLCCCIKNAGRRGGYEEISDSREVAGSDFPLRRRSENSSFDHEKVGGQRMTRVSSETENEAVPQRDFGGLVNRLLASFQETYPDQKLFDRFRVQARDTNQAELERLLGIIFAADGRTGLTTILQDERDPGTSFSEQGDWDLVKLQLAAMIQFTHFWDLCDNSSAAPITNCRFNGQVTTMLECGSQCSLISLFDRLFPVS